MRGATPFFGGPQRRRLAIRSRQPDKLRTPSALQIWPNDYPFNCDLDFDAEAKDALPPSHDGSHVSRALSSVTFPNVADGRRVIGNGASKRCRTLHQNVFRPVAEAMRPRVIGDGHARVSTDSIELLSCRNRGIDRTQNSCLTIA